MRPLAEEEKAWLACAIDGEGYIESVSSVTVNVMKACPTISITNTNKEFIDMIVKLTGATVTESQWKANWSKVYVTHISKHGEVCNLLKQILPYLIVKRSAAEDVICYIESRTWRTYPRTFNV